MQSLYPSLRDVDCAAIARESIIHSNLEFKGLDVNKALAYLRIVAGEEAMRAAGIGNLIPRWKNKKVEALRVTGDTGKSMDNWIFPNQTPSVFQIKLILGLIIEVGVILAMGSHVYEFNGRFFLQLLGGPIGMVLTAWLSSIIMKAFDNLWVNLLLSNNIRLLGYGRYVDDSRVFNNGIQRGWRWVDSHFAFDTKWAEEDDIENLPNDIRTVKLFVQAMNSIMPFLSFTGEAPSEFQNGRLPTLDCDLFVNNGKFCFSFFEKPMRSGKSLDANTALPANTIKSSLRQEIIRRLINMHPSLELSEKIKVLDQFYDKLRFSGHSHFDVRFLFLEALLKFNLLVKNSTLPPDHPSYKPLYLSNDFDRENRGLAKYLQKFNWHIPEASQSDNSWKLEVPVEFKHPSLPKRFSSKPAHTPSTVLFVPNSHQGILLKKLEHAEPMLSRLTGYTCRLVEASGIPLSRLFSLDLTDG